MSPLDNLVKYDIILASASPRRKQLLAELGFNFRVATLDGLDEKYPDEMPWQEIPGYLSALKSKHYTREIGGGNRMVITADTLVMHHGKALGKPADTEEAKQMLRNLSGESHQVITGVTVATAQKNITFSASTDVQFAQLSEDEIEYYVEKFSPLDKAGAYGIQEWIGCIGIQRIEGSFYNVMGLPLHRLYTELKKF